ncbi:MAG TPA: S41 family peptidase [Gemmatimonadaceae bacterium]
MRSRAFIALAALGGALVSGGWLLQRGLERGTGTYARARLFDDVMQHVERDYVDSIPESELYVRATSGMVDELHDPHSVYLTPDRLRKLNESTSGTYVGLGVQIDVRDGWITIISPLPGTPAERAGIQPGDQIVAVNGKSTEGWTPDEARDALRGPPGSTVNILVERPGVDARLPFTVARADIHVTSVRHPMMLTDRVGYVDLTIFSESSEDELRNAIAALRRRGMKTLIFDLRSNPGGLLDQGVSISDMFLDAGDRIVSMRGRAPGSTREFTDDARQLWPDLDLITLVDDHSASAAEIVAGALQDHDRAVILGSTTYGKGSAQSVFPLSDDAGALKLTTARWYTPSGRSIQKERPDTASDDDDDVDGAPQPEDSAAEAPLSQRKAYRTDAGRVVYGGGGITPDLIIASEDSAAGMLAFWRALGKDIPSFRDALTETALAVKASKQVSSPDFTVTPQLRADLWSRMRKKGIALDRASFDSASAAIDRLLAYEIDRYVFGTDAEFRRRAKDDRVIRSALDLAAVGTTQRALLDRAAALRAAKHEDVPHKS